MTWREDANEHWDKIRERMRENPTVIKAQKTAHERAAELQAANAALKQMVSDKDGLLTALRAERDAVARDMRERCAKAAEGPLYKEKYRGKDGHNWWHEPQPGNDAQYGNGRHAAAAAIRALPIRALPILATDRVTLKGGE